MRLDLSHSDQTVSVNVWVRTLTRVSAQLRAAAATASVRSASSLPLQGGAHLVSAQSSLNSPPRVMRTLSCTGRRRDTYKQLSSWIVSRSGNSTRKTDIFLGHMFLSAVCLKWTSLKNVPAAQCVHLQELVDEADVHITSLGSVPAAGGVGTGESTDNTQVNLKDPQHEVRWRLLTTDVISEKKSANIITCQIQN